MSTPEKFPPVMVVVSVLYNEQCLLESVADDLCSKFGKIILRSNPFLFDKTNYYEDEMGNSIKRLWFCFAPLQDPSLLPIWKEECVAIEKKYTSGQKRNINIDPGYLDHDKLVLASYKATSDKIYIGRGVYAHVCLMYKEGHFQAPTHSFADFIDGRFNSYFKLSKLLLKQLIREYKQSQKDQHLPMLP